MSIRREGVRLTAFVAASSLVGCALLIGIDRRPADSEAPDDGPADTDADAAPLREGLCRPSFTETVPPSDAAFGADADAALFNGSFTVALQAFAPFTPSRANLDDRDTDGGETSSCALSPLAPPEVQVWIDRPGGADNAAAALFAAFSGPDTPLRPERIQGQVDRGQLAIAFEVSDYNGEANDEQVTVHFIPLRGLAPNAFSDSGVATVTTRKGDRSDEWVQDEEFSPAGFKLYSTTNARVENGLLSATFRKVSYKLAFFGADVSPPLRVDLHDVLFRSRIVRTPTGELRLTDGDFAGRWRLDEFLEAITALITPSGEPFCNTPQFDVLKGACKIADLAALTSDDVCPAAERDGRLPKPCAAISTYQTFDTYPIDFPARRHLLPAQDAGCEPSLRRCD